MVIELLKKRTERFFHVEEVDHESSMRINRAVQHDLDPIGMTMQPVAAMGLWNIGKPVSCLEFESLGYFHLMPRCLRV